MVYLCSPTYWAVRNTGTISRILGTLLPKSQCLELELENSAKAVPATVRKPSQAVPETSVNLSDTCYSMSAPKAGNRS